MRFLKFIIPGLVAIALIGCQNNPYGAKQTGGALIGGAVGGLAGSQIGHGSGALAATAAGALLGLFVGSEAGKSLDRADQQYAMQAQQQAYAAPVGERITWNNPEIGPFRHHHPGAGRARPDRRLLPRVPDDGGRRGPAAAGLRHGVPRAGRIVEDRALTAAGASHGRRSAPGGALRCRRVAGPGRA